MVGSRIITREIMKIQFISWAVSYVSLRTFAAGSGLVSEVSAGEAAAVKHQRGVSKLGAGRAETSCILLFMTVF